MQQKALKDVLTNEFRDRIKVVEKMDRGVTGNFEVTIVETGKLIHSESHCSTQISVRKCSSRGWDGRWRLRTYRFFYGMTEIFE